MYWENIILSVEIILEVQELQVYKHSLNAHSNACW